MSVEYLIEIEFNMILILKSYQNNSNNRNYFDIVLAKLDYFNKKALRISTGSAIKIKITKAVQHH